MKKIFLGFLALLIVIVFALLLLRKPIAEKANSNGIEAFQAGNYESAETFFTKSLKYQKENIEAGVNLIRTQILLEKNDKALNTIDYLLNIFPKSAEALALKGQIYSLETQYQEAIEILNIAVSQDSSLAFAYYYRGIALANTGQLEAAARDYKRAQELNVNDTQSLRERAIIMGKLENYNEAISSYNQLIELDPSNTDALVRRGTFKMEINDFDGAVRDFTDALSIDPGLEEAYFNRGKSFARENKLEEALADFKKTLELDYKPSSALYNAGMASFHLNKTADAKNYFQQSIKAGASDELKPQAFNILGIIDIQQGNYNRALDYLNRALELSPKDADTYYNRGVAFGLLKEYNKAIEDLEKSKKLGRESADLFFALGVNKISVNNFDGGCTDLKTAEEMGYAQATDMRNQYCRKYMNQ